LTDKNPKKVHLSLLKSALLQTKAQKTVDHARNNIVLPAGSLPTSLGTVNSDPVENATREEVLFPVDNSSISPEVVDPGVVGSTSEETLLPDGSSSGLLEPDAANQGILETTGGLDGSSGLLGPEVADQGMVENANEGNLLPSVDSEPRSNQSLVLEVPLVLPAEALPAPSIELPQYLGSEIVPLSLDDIDTSGLDWVSLLSSLDLFDPSLFESLAQELDFLAQNEVVGPLESPASTSSSGIPASGVSRIGDIVLTPVYREAAPAVSHDRHLGASSSVWTPPMAEDSEPLAKRKRLEVATSAETWSPLLVPSTSAAAIGKYYS
jgi:hypothetical protein